MTSDTIQYCMAIFLSSRNTKLFYVLYTSKSSQIASRTRLARPKAESNISVDIYSSLHDHLDLWEDRLASHKYHASGIENNEMSLYTKSPRSFNCWYEILHLFGKLHVVSIACNASNVNPLTGVSLYQDFKIVLASVRWA